MVTKYFFLKLSGIFLILNMSATSLWAMDTDMSCPKTITVDQRIIDKPGSWDAIYGGNQHQLKVVTFFDGPPSEMAALVYDRIVEKKKEIIASWDFLSANKRGYWIECSYEATNASLAKAVASSVKGCKVIYERDPDLPGNIGEIKAIICEEDSGVEKTNKTN